MTPSEALLSGRRILDPILEPHGFEYSVTSVDKGSGGDFASAEYSSGERRLELHFRYSLGLVQYHFGIFMSLSHEEYMTAKLGGPGRSAYPGFSADPIDGFRHLREDLESYCSEFLSGDRVSFGNLVDMARRLPRRRLPQ